MKISKVIEMVDELQPNIFDIEYKLKWCYECTCVILDDCPEYGTKEIKVAEDGGVVPLPMDVKLTDVAALFVNGRSLPITNATDYNDYTFRKGDKVTVVYREYPDEYELSDAGNIPEDYETFGDRASESMYVDYVCAQIAFQQNDAPEFNKFMGMFNDKFAGYKARYGSNAPANAPRRFENWF